LIIDKLKERKNKKQTQQEVPLGKEQEVVSKKETSIKNQKPGGKVNNLSQTNKILLYKIKYRRK
jgi:hypothetical protein